MKKPKEKKVCVKGKGEECFNVIKLEKRMEEKKTCSFHPKTVCHPSRMKECRQVKKKMMKKPKEKKVCVKGKGEECFNVIKLEKRMEEKKTCSFHPKTVCH